MNVNLTIVQAIQHFSDESNCEVLMLELRWPDGLVCPHYDSTNVRAAKNRKPAPLRCRACRKHFSFKTGTVMEDSALLMSKWFIAAYLIATNIKGISSRKLAQDVEVTQRTAWHMAHRM